MRERNHVVAAELLRSVLGSAAAGSVREGTALLDLADVCERLGDTACRREALERYLERQRSGALREDVRVKLCRFLQRTGPSGAFESCLEEYLAEFPEGHEADWARGALSQVATTPATPTGDER